MEKLIYEIAGKRYILIEDLITESTQKDKQKIIKKYNCITQGVKEVKRGFFGGHAVISLLVPEENLIAFNEENNS